jgi:hypothetical protein
LKLADTRPAFAEGFGGAAFARRATIDQGWLADLTIAIGLMNAYNRLAIGFRNPPKAAT